MIGKQKKGLEMTTTINKEQKNPNVPNLRFPEFSGEWMYSTIGSEFDLYSGNTPSRLNKEQFKGDVNWISSGELKEHYISETKEKITQEAAKNNNLKLLPIGTFVIAIYGLEAEGIRGTCSITRGLSTISQACMAFTPIGSITNEFLYSWYKKHGNLIGIKYAQGTKQQNLSYDIISQFQIDYPQREEQVKLEQFISLLDERIATQNKIIDKLQSLIKGIRYDIFNDIQGEELALSNIADIYQPQTISSSDLTTEEYWVYGANGIIGKYKEYNHETEQICITCRGNTCGTVNYTQPKVWITGNSMVINTDKYQRQVNKRFLFHYLSSYNFNSIVSGSGQPQIVRTPLEKIKVVLPTIEKQVRIANSIDIVSEKIDTESLVLRLLENQKQYLLRQMFI